MSCPPALTWTDADQQECLRLMYKARDCGTLPALMKHVMEAEKGWDYIPSASTRGAMNDASKRLRENESPKSYAAHGGVVPVPMPSAASTQLCVSKLPPGVKNVEEWGRNMVSFGKYMGKRSYASIYQSDEDDVISYKRWLMAHYAKGSPQLRDLVDYLTEMKDRVVVSTGSDQGVLIPGTNIQRRLLK